MALAHSEPSDPELAILERLLLRTTPFPSGEALQEGATYAMLRRFVNGGLLSHPVRGVYHGPHLPDSLQLRIAVLKLVVPEDCVVTDRTAGWLWGAPMVLEPGAHLSVPDVSVFCPPGRRLRIGLVNSGERRLSTRDVAVIDGLRVTTPLRTACDAGRLLHRDQAMAVMDSLAHLGTFEVEHLLTETLRFKGYRGVIQLRALGPLVDARAESPGESALRLRWYDAHLPRPECQVEVPAPNGGSYYIDIGLPGDRFGAEYDGEEFHGEADEEHDEGRRCWIRREQGWTLAVARKENVYGLRQDIDVTLRSLWAGLK